MKYKIFLISFCITLFSLGANAQSTVTVTGTVKDEKGAPVSDVTVKESNTNQSVITGKNGSFSIVVSSSNSSLEFTHVSFQPSVIPLNNRAEIQVVLVEDAQSLSDVVVVGYGRQKKSSLTGSVSSVKGAELVKSNAVNLSNALTGRVPGFFSKQESGKPGGDAAGFSIRGVNTVGNNSPLTLIDGIPRDINNIDPNEIESVTVLKDASASAIYGVRGSNGVILVTTKRGKGGKPTISYNVNYGITNTSRPFKWLTATQFARTLNESKLAQGLPIAYTEAEIDIITNNPDNLNKTPTGWGLANSNWFDAVFKKNVPQVQHNITINGGGPRMKYFVSLGYTHQNGFFKTADFKRYNLRSNIDGQVTDEINVKFDIGARFEKRSDIPTNAELYWPLYFARPTDPIRYPNGLLTATTNGFNPLSQADSTGYYRTENNVFLSALTLEFKPKWAKGFTLRQVVSADKTFSKTKNFSYPYSYYLHDPATDTYNKLTRPGSINLTEGTGESPVFTTQTILDYAGKFGKHEINALLVYEAAKQTSTALQGTRTNFITPEIDQLFAGPTTGATNFGTSSQYARLGQAGRLDYTYNGKYIVNFSFRRDGSVNFAPENRFGFFPGVSVGWNISRENFISENLRFINNLKIRASYGQLGNDRLAVRFNDPYNFNFGNNNPYNSSFNSVEFPYLNLFGYGNPYIVNGLGAPTLNSIGVPNSSLTWETCTTKEVGLELSAFNNRLTFEASLYEKRTKDMLNVKTDIPASFGSSSSFENAGESRVRGIELSLRFDGKIGDVRYYVSPNFSTSRGKLLVWPDPPGTPEYLKRQGHILFPFTGLVSTGLIRTQKDLTDALPQYRALALGDIGYADLNGDGRITDNDQGITDKSLVPQTFFGMDMGVAYNNFDLSMLWQGASDFYFYPILAMQAIGGNINAPQYLLDYYSASNTDAHYPRLTAGNQDPNNSKLSTFWVNDVTYIKLRNIQLGYTLPQRLLTKLRIQQLRFNVTGSNLLTFSNLKHLGHLDPEHLSYAWNNSNNNYPLTRVFSFGLNLTF